MKWFGSSRSNVRQTPAPLTSVLRLLPALLALSMWLATPSTAASLARSAKKGDLAKVEALIAAGADLDKPDSRGNTPIYHAASKGHADVVEALAQAGADVDSENGFGSTPLHIASYEGHVEVIRVLVTYGANIDAVNAPRGSGNLLANGSGASLIRRGPTPSTPMMKAARAGELEAVKTLIELGAKLPARDAVKQAQQKGHKEIAAYITKATRDRKGQRMQPGGSAPPESIVFTADYGRRIAAVVGISRYTHLSNLEGAARDAKATGDMLRALGFDEVLELYDEDATRESILDLLGNQLQRKTTANDLAFIFFAGHGTTETLPNGEKRGYLVPTDGTTEDAYTTGISMETIRDLSNRLPAKHVYYAIDACYSGSLAVSRGQGRPNTPSQRIQAVQMLTAGTEGQQAIEQGGRGVFTTYLLQGMRGEADRNGDKVVTASEIGWFVSDQVRLATKSRQTPVYGRMSGAGEVAFGMGSQ
ncbi:MAG: ankyrin repeat domain-containing protein [Myxococcales bacterium]|nr:ankyrin repeat domain-containing protein [Myxococcales bacterium]